MNVSLNWLNEYIDLKDYSPEQVADLLTDLGLEVEGIEHIGGLQNDLTGVVVGHVLTCEKHPDADKLSLTTVNIGTDTPLSIVCGAPNVRAGQKVAVATIGTTLTFSDGKVVKMKEGKIRGAVSQGMICAEDELGIGTDHSGIMVLDADLPVGMPFVETLNIEKDVVFEVGLTPNRSDATCHLGVAKDLAARLKVHTDKGDVKMPDVSAFEVASNNLKIAVTVEDTEGCPRYSGVCIEGVKIGESPEWLKKRLSAIGVNVINNVVDATNFILHELGQPLHAFDYDKIGGQKIAVKCLEAGTPFLSLKKNESGEYVTLKLNAEDLMICDGNNVGMCIGGVIGNPSEGVSETTTNIFLESAHFNAKRLRRTSFSHNTRTDAAKTFEKGTDPNVTVYALKRAAMLITAVAGGKIASDIVDIYPNKIENKEIRVNFENVESLIGQKFDNRYIKKILNALEMETIASDTEGVVVRVPSNKADVLREADIVEEILRVHSFNNVPMPGRISTAVVPSVKPDPVKLRNLIADTLVAQGFNEMMALSLSQSKYYADADLVAVENLVRVANTSNVDLDIMRPTMLVSALEAVAHNQNRQSINLRLFEFGKTYQQREDNKFEETSHLVLTVSGAKMAETWRQKTQSTDYFALKSFVNLVLQRLGISGLQETTFSNAQFAYAMRYHRGAQVLVEFGKVQGKLRKKMGVKQDVYFADFQWDNIIKSLKTVKVGYEEISKYPSVRRDLALVVDTAVKFGDIASLAQKSAKKLLTGVNLFDVFEDETKLGAGKKSYAVSFIFEDKEKTLQDKDIDRTMSELISIYETKLGALIRR